MGLSLGNLLPRRLPGLEQEEDETRPYKEAPQFPVGSNSELHLHSPEAAAVGLGCALQTRKCQTGWLMAEPSCLLLLGDT